MLLVTTIAAVRARREELRRESRRLAFVPTMGALHDGHLALVRRAKELTDEVWASVFVNPAQFAPDEDFARYPRDLERDRALLAKEGVALLFAPTSKEIYPRPPLTVIDLPDLAGALCGAHRPGHFRGVTLVVAKLFNIVQPDVAIFGAKDAQQAAIIRRMVDDLNFPLRVEVVPTVREGDGLALSSRNAHLDSVQRGAAKVLHHALQQAVAALHGGEHRGALLETIIAREVGREPMVLLEYAAAVHPETMQPVAMAEGGLLLAVAARVGNTRLIDNLTVEVP